jgi:hypothetical protein
MRVPNTLFGLLMLGLPLWAQNVGIGTASPASRLSVMGNLSIGNTYAGTAAPANGAIIEGNTGIGTSNPAHRLHVVGDVRFVGDFINQEVTGSNASAVQAIPYNATYYPIAGTTVSITIPDGSGPDHSGVFISGFARIVNNTTMTGTPALAGYFLLLVRAEDAAFTVNRTLLTYSITPRQKSSISQNRLAKRFLALRPGAWNRGAWLRGPDEGKSQSLFYRGYPAGGKRH